MKTETPLAKKIIGFAMKVHGKLGPGFSERVNQNALVVECSRAGLEIEAFKEIKVLYEGVTVGEFVADMFVREAALVLESGDEPSRATAREKRASSS